MKHIARLHPFLFVLASIVFLYPQSAIIASPGQIVRPILVLWFLLVLLAGLALWLARDPDWAAILLTIFVLGICSSIQFFFAAGLVSLVVLVLWFIVMRLRKRRVTLGQVGELLTFTGFLLFVVIAVPLVRQLSSIPPRPDAPLPPLAQLESPDVLPDIYYIVLDGYARADVLDGLYDFDNSEFETALGSRGFIIPALSRSNYPKTALSVTSTLNMDYVQSFVPGLEEQPFWWLMSPYLDHSRVRAALENLGYQTISIATDWNITDNPTTDLYYSPKSIILGDFEYYLLSKTPLGFVKPWLARVSLIPSHDSHRELIRFNFETLAQIPSLPGPKFVFAHIIAPHPPFVFDEDGASLQPDYPFSFNDASDFSEGDEAYLQGYLGQLKFVNRQVVQLMDDILAGSEIPPVIILQADHGPGLLTDFDSLAATCLKERFSIFAAYHLPGVDAASVPPDMVPVNTFRLIFNQYFSADLPLLDARHFYYSGVYIYHPEDVTPLVDTCTLP